MAAIVYYKTQVGKEIPTAYADYIVKNSIHDVEFVHEQCGSMKQFRRLQNAVILGLCEKLIINTYEDLGDDELMRLEHWLFLKRHSVGILMINPRKIDLRYHIINGIKSFFETNASGWGVRHGDLLPSQYKCSSKKVLPFGYVANENTLAVCEVEAVLVRELFRAYADGEKLSAILPKFDDMLTRYGNPFSIVTLKMMVSSSRYTGIAQKRQASDLPGIISYSEWFKVLRRLEAERRAFANKQISPVFRRISAKDRKIAYIDDREDLRYSPYAHKCDLYYVVSSKRLNSTIVNVLTRIFKESDPESLYNFCVKRRQHLEVEHDKISSHKINVEQAFSDALKKLISGKDFSEDFQEKLDELRDECYFSSTRFRRSETEIELFSISEESIKSFFQHALNLVGASFQEVSYFANLLIHRIKISGNVAKLYYVSLNTGKIKCMDVSDILCEPPY